MSKYMLTLFWLLPILSFLAGMAFYRFISRIFIVEVDTISAEEAEGKENHG